MRQTRGVTVAPTTRSRRVGISVGLTLLVALVIAGVWAFQRSSAEPQPVAEPLPVVVLVTGYAGDGSDTEPLAEALRVGGREVAVFPRVGDNTGDLIEQARLLGQFIDTTLTDPINTAPGDTQSVDVIGFSAGGVVARLWAADFAGDTMARRILTIAAPHHGTRLATLADLGGFCEGACAQLVPDSELLASLNAGDETPAGPEWITIWSEQDRTVTPVQTANLDGSLGFTVQSVCLDARTGHLEMPMSPVILAALKTVLGPDAPAAPTAADVDCQN